MSKIKNAFHDELEGQRAAEDGMTETHPIGTGERLKRLEDALRPLAEFADPRVTVPGSFRITAGSPFARNQLTMGDCYRARDALSTLRKDEDER